MREEPTHLLSIVDDDPSVREAALRLAKTNGFRMECFSSAAEFLKSTHISETECLILDLKMQGMNGLELQRHLVRENSRIPIIFYAATASPEIREEALRTGAIDFLPKPCSEEAMLKAIRTALQSGRNVP